MNELRITINGTTKSLNQNTDFVLENAENMRWGKLDLATTTNPFVEGDIIQNTRGMVRDIQLTLRFLNGVTGAEAARQWFYTSFGTTVTLTWLGEYNDTLTISGLVDDIDETVKQHSSIVTLSIHCSQPYWEGTERTLVCSNAEQHLTFAGNAPFGFTIDFDADIYNPGDVYEIPEAQLQFIETDSTYVSWLKRNVVSFWSEETIQQGTLDTGWRYSTVRGNRHLITTGTAAQGETYDEFVHGYYFYAKPNQPYIVEMLYKGESEITYTFIPFTLKYKPRYL